MRWSLAAHDICFTNKWHSYFFMFGKCIPIVRGNGVYQDAINFCIEKLGCGDWVHVFPEGKVNMYKDQIRYVILSFKLLIVNIDIIKYTFVRLKWGIGRLIMESPITPIVIPIYHYGFDEVLPNFPPYYIRTGKKITLNYGEPIDFTDIIANLKKSNATEIEIRKTITDKIDDELQR